MPERDNKGRWKKGQSGNPNGRPKRGTALSDLLRATGDELSGGVPNKVRLARVLWEMALDGEVAAIRLIYDRCEGLARQSIEVDAETELVITYVNDWRTADEETTGE